MTDTLTYIGGATSLLTFAGLRAVTDPTFDPKGSAYSPGPYTLTRTTDPVAGATRWTNDVVLLSHDHHYDNLDNSGRQWLTKAPAVLTTPEAAGRLRGAARGMRPWEQVQMSSPDGGMITITATPCQHGPVHAERGPVTGFLLEHPSRAPVYISGDTVWFDGMADVAAAKKVATAILFLGAAEVDAVGPFPLTMTAEEGVEAARAFAGATIVPLHFEGWAHFREGKAEVDAAFARAGMSDRLRWPVLGQPIPI